MSYLISNEDGDSMRIVGRQEEAQAICALRLGWTYRIIRRPRLRIDLSLFEDALI